MPELPEVETFVRTLRDGRDGQASILGAQIDSAEVYWHKTVAVPTAEEFTCLIRGETIREISRRGKFLVFRLEKASFLIHLRMSGDLLVLPAGNSELPGHVRLALRFTDGRTLVFNDPRKFGRVWLVEDAKVFFKDLGQEPLDPGFTADVFYQMLKNKKKNLKPLLLDQSFLAGIGNIYSDEALHISGLHPLRKSNDLAEVEAAALLEALRAVLLDGIRRNGSSIDWVYRGGDFQNQFRVYGKTNQPCPVCGTPITHLTVGSRSTHICSKCQPLED